MLLYLVSGYMNNFGLSSFKEPSLFLGDRTPESSEELFWACGIWVASICRQYFSVRVFSGLSDLGDLNVSVLA